MATWLLPLILSATAGAVDVIGFLSLGGLFTAHITGNIVILAAHYVTGGYSQTGPLLSVPVFIAMLWVVTVRFRPRGKATGRARRSLLALQAAFLASFLVVGLAFGPFADADGGMAVFAGMLGVAAMATQNALVRLALPGSPSTAVLTTNTTQLTIDLATLTCVGGMPAELTHMKHRAFVTCASVAGFVIGCTAGAMLELHFGLRALVLPVALALAAIPAGERWTAEEGKGDK